MAEPVRLMTTEEVGDRVRRSQETLRWWRHVGLGPRSFKLGRRVMYAADDVEGWIAAERERQDGGPRDVA